VDNSVRASLRAEEDEEEEEKNDRDRTPHH